MSGWVYSYEDGFIVLTNQNPEYGYDPNATKEDGFITEAVYFDRGPTTLITKNAKGKVKIEGLKEEDIKPYTVYGADCSRIVVTYRVYDIRSISIINKN